MVTLTVTAQALVGTYKELRYTAAGFVIMDMQHLQWGAALPTGTVTMVSGQIQAGQEVGLVLLPAKLEPVEGQP